MRACLAVTNDINRMALQSSIGQEKRSRRRRRSTKWGSMEE